MRRSTSTISSSEVVHPHDTYGPLPRVHISRLPKGAGSPAPAEIRPRKTRASRTTATVRQPAPDAAHGRSRPPSDTRGRRAMQRDVVDRATVRAGGGPARSAQNTWCTAAGPTRPPLLQVVLRRRRRVHPHEAHRQWVQRRPVCKLLGGGSMPASMSALPPPRPCLWCRAVAGEGEARHECNGRVSAGARLEPRAESLRRGCSRTSGIGRQLKRRVSDAVGQTMGEQAREGRS